MALSITPQLIIKAARERKWGVEIIDDKFALYKLILPDGRFYYIKNITSRKSSSINSFLAGKKNIMYSLAQKQGIRIPETIVYSDFSTAEKFLDTHQELVVKPADQAHGDGITVEVKTSEELREAIEHAGKITEVVLLQRHLPGDDYRILCIGGQIAAAVVRKPAFVVADGIHTTGELIELENRGNTRQDGYNAVLTTIDLAEAKRYLGSAIDETNPNKDQEVQVMGTANIGKGGVSIDVTDELEDELKQAVIKLVKHFDLGLAGVDFIKGPDGLYYFIEINTAPSLGLHEMPYRGHPRQTPEAFLDWLAKTD